MENLVGKLVYCPSHDAFLRVVSQFSKTEFQIEIIGFGKNMAFDKDLKNAVIIPADFSIELAKQYNELKQTADKCLSEMHHIKGHYDLPILPDAD